MEHDAGRAVAGVAGFQAAGIDRRHGPAQVPHMDIETRLAAGLGEGGFKQGNHRLAVFVVDGVDERLADQPIAGITDHGAESAVAFGDGAVGIEHGDADRAGLEKAVEIAVGDRAGRGFGDLRGESPDCRPTVPRLVADQRDILRQHGSHHVVAMAQLDLETGNLARRVDCLITLRRIEGDNLAETGGAVGEFRGFAAEPAGKGLIDIHQPAVGRRRKAADRQVVEQIGEAVAFGPEEHGPDRVALAVGPGHCQLAGRGPARRGAFDGAFTGAVQQHGADRAEQQDRQGDRAGAAGRGEHAQGGDGGESEQSQPRLAPAGIFGQRRCFDVTL